MKSMSMKWSLWSYIIAVIAISSLTIIHSNKGKLNVIQYDVAGYYSYLPAIFIYKDIKELNWRKEVSKSYHIAGIDDVASDHVSGQKVMKYSLGMAISFLPGFALAHIYALNSAAPADGFSGPYQLGLILVGWFYMLIALWYLRKILDVYFEDWIVATTLLIIAIGTNYFIYAGSQSMMSHAFLFMLFTLVIYNTIKWYSHKSYWRIIAIGMLMGLITITRPTEILLTLVVLLWGVSNISELKERAKLLYESKVYIILAILVAALVIGIQLGYWKFVSGDWIVYSYKDEGFTWDGRYLRECFVGFRKGWLIYTPVMLLGLVGLYHLYTQKNTSSIAKPIILFLIISTYIIFSWDNYWYGGGFGQRAMISSYVLYALAIASLLQSVQRKAIWIQYLTGAFIVFCIWLNIFQTLQAQLWGGFETSNMTKKYYFKIFGESDINPDWKVLLDNKDAKMGKVKNSTTLFNLDFENEVGSLERPYKDSKTIKISEGLYTLLDQKISTLRKGQRLRAEVMVSGGKQVWNRWSMTNFHIQLYTNGKVVGDQNVRLHDVSRSADWKSIHVDIKVRQDNVDQIKVVAWSGNTNQDVYLDNLKVSIIE